MIEGSEYTGMVVDPLPVEPAQSDTLTAKVVDPVFADVQLVFRAYDDWLRCYSG